MKAIELNKIYYTRKLRAAGVSDRQARIQLEAIDAIIEKQVAGQNKQDSNFSHLFGAAITVGVSSVILAIAIQFV